MPVPGRSHLILLFLLLVTTVNAFTVPFKSATIQPVSFHKSTFGHRKSYGWYQLNIENSCRCRTVLSLVDPDGYKLQRVSSSLEFARIPFIDPATNSYIECYADSVLTIEGVTYTIAAPCNYPVALWYFDDDQVIPVEPSDPLMDDIYPIAEAMVAEEFGEEIVLQRTPKTLTLDGVLKYEFKDDLDYSEEELDQDESVVDLLSFVHRGLEFSLVRLLDPILLVGKDNPDDDVVRGKERGGTRLLLTPQESDVVLPILEDLFREFHDSPNSIEHYKYSRVTLKI